MKLSATLVIAACLVGNIYVRAQSTETGTSVSTGSSTEGSSSGAGAVCTITTSSLPSATVGVAYGPGGAGVQLTSANCPGPLTWSVSVGTLAGTGLSLSPSGLLSGTPLSAGDITFTVKVVGTPSTVTDIFDAGLSITASSSSGDPTPPDPALVSWDTRLSATPSPNSIITVGDGSGSPCDQTGGVCSYPTSQLAVALSTVGCGQTVEIQNVPVVLPAGVTRFQQNCNASNYITITRDFSDTTFPAEGIRVTPCYAGIPSSALPGEPPYPCPNPSRHMPLLLKPTSSQDLQFGSSNPADPGSSYIHFVGIQFGRQTNYDIDFGILNLLPVGCTAVDANCMNHQPNHIIFDRCIVQGDPQRQTTRGIYLGGQWIAVKDSYVHDIFLSFAGGGGDAQAFAGAGGKFITNLGWWKITNTHASASTMGCLFCGSFTEPLSPITNHDGVPHDILWTQTRWWKNPLWNPMIGQALNRAINIEGVNYGPTADQEFIVSPSAVQVQQGTTFDLHNTTLNDSGGGWDRMTTSGGGGSVTIDGLSCNYTATTTVGTTAPGTTVVVASVANLANNHSILIVGAGSGSHNYIGTITAVSGTTLTISPATTTSVANGKSVYDPVCVPGGLGVGDSTHGHLIKKSEDSIGVAPYFIQNVIEWTYIACSGAGVPFADCTGATTAAAHTLIFNDITVDGRAATMGNSRTLPSTVTVTVTSGTPTNQIALSPSAPDLSLQPSYSDAFGNVRQYADVFFAVPNFTSTSLTWKVCDVNGLNCVTNGNSTVGQICLVTAIPCTAPGSNDKSVAYVSGTATGTHTITVTSAGGTTTSQIINVTTSSPILGYDLKPFTAKNGWESKCVSRGIFSNSIIENVWATQANGGFQVGSFILNQPINQSSQTLDGNGATVGYGPEFISDLLVDHIYGIHASAGVIVAGLNESLGTHRIKYKDILFEDLNAYNWLNGVAKPQFSDVFRASGAGGTKVLSWTSSLSPILDNVYCDHFTSVGGTLTNPGVANWLSITNNNAQFQLGPFGCTNSIVTVPGSTTFNNNNGDSPDCNVATGSGSSNTEARAFQGVGNSLSRPCFSTYSINRVALVDNTTAPGNFTSTIWQPSSTDVDLFRNPSAGDFRVVIGGRYDAGGTRDALDGSALGADSPTIYNNNQGIRLGVSIGFPMTITTSSLPSATHGSAYSQTLSVSGGTAPYTWSTPADIVPADAFDILDYAAMPLPDRNNFHLSGTIVKYFKLDAGLLWWLKGVTGNPWDGEVVGSDYIKQWFTEDIFSNASSYKMYLTPVSLWKRYHIPGADDVVFTPGPNKYSTTTNCGADGSPQTDNGGVRGELTGPFTDVTWQTTYGGNIPDNTPYLLAQKWLHCTANDITQCTDEEDYWLVKGYGQVRWCPKSWNGSTYVTGTCSQETTKTAGGAPTPNFACGLPKPPTSTLPPGALLTSAPAMTIVDSTGEIKGIPNTAGTYTFTVQVKDANGLISQKTFTLLVN